MLLNTWIYLSNKWAAIKGAQAADKRALEKYSVEAGGEYE